MNATNLPVDVLYSIVDVIADYDRGILFQIALLNKDFSRYAQRHIWGTISLIPRNGSAMDAKHVLDRCQWFLRNPGRMTLIRRLTIESRTNFWYQQLTTGVLSGPPSQRASEAAKLPMMYAALADVVFACSEHLEELSITGDNNLADIGTALSWVIIEAGLREATGHDSAQSARPLTSQHPILPFPRLRTLRTALSPSLQAGRFLRRACANITTLDIAHDAIYPASDVWTHDVPPEFFPHLEVFRASTFDLHRITVARPVRSISLRNSSGTLNGWNLYKTQVLEAILASTVPVESFNLGLWENPPNQVPFFTGLFYELSLAAPRLRNLRIDSRSVLAKDDYSDDAMQAFAAGVTVFQSLEVFVWLDERGTHWAGKFARTCFSQASKLRCVVIEALPRTYATQMIFYRGAMSASS